MSVRRLVPLLVLALFGLVAAGAAFADLDKEQVRITAEGQAAARAALPRQADFGAGWTSKSYRPGLDGGFSCASFHPKQSDLVRNGAAGVTFTRPGMQIDTEAQVLETDTMVALDWQRTVLSPQVLPCMRTAIAKTMPPSATFVSLRRLAFPKVSTYTNVFRVLVDVHASGTTIRMSIDIALFGRGRTELTMTTTAPLAADATVRPAEVRLARLLVARANS